ncbi:DUF2804 domain-containing protein [Paucibacter sp. AS339]|uniref:DUF2804 domain-containing protein n=1 Tax=Paucibacter hankyongi TaxID=3133434 RepID=UPI0030A711CF
MTPAPLRHQPSALPPVPANVVVDGAPASGRYAGRIARIDWQGLAGPYRRSGLWRHFHHKRWQYVGIGNEELFIGLAIVDLGWICTAFAYVFDRRSKTLLADWSQDGLPGLSALQCRVSEAPISGAQAHFRGLGAHLKLEHRGADDSLALSVDCAALQLEARMALAEAAPMLLAIGSIEAGGGVAHATQKSSALPVSGHVHVKGRPYSLEGATACVDSSNGLLSRHTDWRWASAHRADVGFNLQSGYFGANENALWLDGQLIPLGAARFEFDAARPLQPWRVSSDDGLLDLSFSPEGARQQDKNLLVAASHYVQPIGTFSGWVKAASDAPSRPVEGLLGVTEDHRSTW